MDVWLDGSSSLMITLNKEQKGDRTSEVVLLIWSQAKKNMKDKNHLFDVEDKEVFDGADGRQHRAVECADPADGLTIDDL